MFNYVLLPLHKRINEQGRERQAVAPEQLMSSLHRGSYVSLLEVNWKRESALLKSSSKSDWQYVLC